MDPKYFIIILFFEYLKNTFFSETEAIITEKQPQSTLFTSSVPTNSQNRTENPLGQPVQFNTISSGQPISSARITDEQPTPAVYVSSGKPITHISSGSSAYNITRQPIPIVNASFPRTALPVFTSARQLPPSTHTPMRQTRPPLLYTSPKQPPLLVHNSSERPVLLTVHNLSTQPTSTVYLPRTVNLSRITSEFITEPTSSERIPHKTNYNATAAILIGVILISMLLAIFMIILWKCLKKPVLNDQNWAGRSPFADGETPDICMDNIRENEVPTKRTSIVSLMTWKPSKSTLLADDLEVKLFESSENIEDPNNPKKEKIKDQVNGTSEDSAGGSTIGTAVSSSDDADLPLPPSLLALGQESNQSDQPTMIIVPPLPHDSANFHPSLDSLNQACEDHNSEIKQPFPPHSDSLNLPLPPVDFIKNEENFNSEIQCQEFPIPPDSDQDLNESLPPPPAELL
uniref:Protein EVI2B n=1 Tax=Castor canadensis TaxID=51338 RepID=A0A250YIA6_CASCN|nr:protein EVI2B [Castor canadensis]